MVLYIGHWKIHSPPGMAHYILECLCVCNSFAANQKASTENWKASSENREASSRKASCEECWVYMCICTFQKTGAATFMDLPELCLVSGAAAAFI